MRLEIIIASFKSDLKTFIRSKGTLFWTVLFPIMLILIFGAIFSGMDETEIEIQVLDLDNSQFSNQLLDGFNESGLLKVKMAEISSEDNVLSYIQDNDLKRFLIIPHGYGETLIPPVDHNASVNLTFYYDQSEQNSNQIIRNIISNVIQSINMGFTGGRNVIGIDDVETISGEFGFIDFFLPGMIGFTIMQTCIYGSLERNTKFRKDGILRKLLTTPITRSEWIFSKMLFQLFLSFLSAILIIIIGILVFGLNVNITFLMIVIVIATSFLFTGMGMVIGRFVKDEESASMAGGAVTFPMMFLAGTFFELEMMPEFLQTFARILPLYYVNEGLRNAMIYLKTDDAIFHSMIVLIFAAVFFIGGILLTKWRED